METKEKVKRIEELKIVFYEIRDIRDELDSQIQTFNIQMQELEDEIMKLEAEPKGEIELAYEVLLDTIKESHLDSFQIQHAKEIIAKALNIV